MVFLDNAVLGQVALEIDVSEHSVRDWIPQVVLDNKLTCSDYNACLQQNRQDFGFIPISPLRL